MVRASLPRKPPHVARHYTFWGSFRSLTISPCSFFCSSHTDSVTLFLFPFFVDTCHTMYQRPKKREKHAVRTSWRPKARKPETNKANTDMIGDVDTNGKTLHGSGEPGKTGKHGRRSARGRSRVIMMDYHSRSSNSRRSVVRQGEPDLCFRRCWFV